MNTLNLGDPGYPVACTFGLSLLRLGHLPPSWFLTTLTGSSTFGPVSLLHLTDDLEVHRVAAPWSRSRNPARTFPPVHTLQSLPLS